LLELLDVEGKFDILENKEGESVDIVLDTKDTGIVIGYHGETMEGLQLVISLCVARKLGRFVRISLEVGDYKKNRTEWLKSLAKETKERVLSENKEIFIPELKSWERRVVHLLLENDDKVMSESQGEGRDRVLVVKPKN
ncbi:MAG: R3H domain-containing nucleic acid-binding protein, partial [Patescibacteria group bacterium]